jgi:hypothetical protein
VAGQAPSVLGEVHHLLVSTGGASPRAQAILRGWATYLAGDLLTSGQATDSPLDQLLLPTWVGEREFVLASEAAVVPAIEETPGLRAFIDRPRIAIATLGPDHEQPSDLAVTFDLLLDDVRILADEPAGPDAAALGRMWYGVVETALKTEHVLRSAAVLEPEALRMTGASFEMARPLTVVDPSTAASLPSTAPDALRDALESGWIAVVPGDPGSSRVWWTVSPTDGTTRSFDEPGLSNTKIGGQPPQRPSNPVKPPDKRYKIERKTPPTKPGNQRRPPGWPTNDTFERDKKRGSLEYGIVTGLVGLSVLIAVDIGTDILVEEALAHISQLEA